MNCWIRLFVNNRFTLHYSLQPLDLRNLFHRNHFPALSISCRSEHSCGDVDPSTSSETLTTQAVVAAASVNDDTSTLHRRDAAHYNEEEDEEEILGSDDDEQEDPKDYCKGNVDLMVGGSQFIVIVRWKLWLM